MSGAEKIVGHGELGPGVAANTVVHAGFAVTGVITTLLGPLLPVLINRWGLTDARAGVFFSAQYFAALAGAVTLSTLLAWRGYKLVFVGGFALMAVGISALLHGNLTMGFVATGIYGYGLGLILSATNLWVAETAGPRRAAAISIVNVAWGLGAISCPALVAFAQKEHAVPTLLTCAGALAGLAALTLATMNLEPRSDAATNATSVIALPPIRKMIAVPLGVFFFLYVGSEKLCGRMDGGVGEAHAGGHGRHVGAGADVFLGRADDGADIRPHDSAAREGTKFDHGGACAGSDWQSRTD